MKLLNSQEAFWVDQVAESYARENAIFSKDLGIKAWRRMLQGISTSDINSYLECGSNIGRNIGFLREILPEASASIIEISSVPYRDCLTNYPIESSFLGAIKDAQFQGDFNLVFTSGVLIHVSPVDLDESMTRMYELSNRYILIAEYFNRTPVSIEYRGEMDKLFKLDFGRMFMEKFNCSIIDYGFLWGYEYDAAGFDDFTYWLFEKNSNIQIL